MAGEETVTREVRRRFDVAPERLFDAWLDPEIAGRWLFATATVRIVRVDIDARVGGKFDITENRDGEDFAHVGEYPEIDRPRRLVLTFGVPKYSPRMTRVTIEIAPVETGSELILSHEDVPPEYESGNRAGWR